MTPSNRFVLSKSTKMMLAMMPGTKADRANFRSSMVQAELAEEAAKRASLKSKDHKDSNGGSKGSKRTHGGSVAAD